MKLFVATEYLAEQGTILATRRRRAPGEQAIWAAHLAIVDGEAVGRPEVETDRARFLGRGHDVHQPIAVIDGRGLSNTVGTVLDPVFALRRRVRVAPGAIVRIAFWTVVADSRGSGAGPGRQASRRHRVRAGGHVGLDPGAGAAPSSRYRSRRGGPVPTSRRPPAACRPDAAAVFRHHPARRRRTAGAVAHGHFRRPADPAAAHRRHRTPRSRPATAAGTRILANEAARGGPGDPERACVVLRPGPANGAGDPGPDEPVVIAGRRGATAGPRLRAAGRSDFAGKPRLARLGGAGRSGWATWNPRRSARPRT